MSTTSGAGGRLGRMSLALFVVAVILAAGVRLLYGVDLTDEPYYATFPFRFVLGDVPYVSDLNVRQNAGLITLPIVALWMGVTDGAEGLILVLRIAHLLTRIALLALTIRAFRKHVPLPLAAIAGLVPVAFAFAALPTLGYNTIAASAITAALLALHIWNSEGRRRYAATALAGAAVAAFAHPALALASIAVAGAVVWSSPTAEDRRWSLRALGAALAFGIVIALLVMLGIGSDSVTRLVQEASVYTGPGPNSERLSGIYRTVGKTLRATPILMALWVSLWILPKLSYRAAAAVLATYAVLASFGGFHAIIIWYAIASLPVAWHNCRSGSRIDLWVASLSVMAGILVSLFSTNGVRAMSVGAEAAAIVFFMGTWKFLAQRSKREAILAKVVPLATAALAVVQMIAGQYREIYRDDAVGKLTATVPNGPYRWMRTTPEKRDYLLRLQNALGAHEDGKGSLLVFNRVPGAQLMATLPPALPMTWVADQPDAYVVRIREVLGRELARAKAPILVLQVFRLINSSESEERWDYQGVDALRDAVFAAKPRELARTDEFAVYVIEAR